QSWKLSLPVPASVVTSPALAFDGTIYVGTESSEFYAINPGGTLKWTFNHPNGSGATSAAVAGDGTIYVGCQDTDLYALNPASSTKWTFSTGGPVGSSPAIGADGTVYVGSDDDHLYALGAPPAAAACCGAQRMVLQTVGAESLVKIGTLSPFALPA